MDEIPLLVDLSGDQPERTAFATESDLEAYVEAEGIGNHGGSVEQLTEEADYAVEWVTIRGMPCGGVQSTVLERAKRREVRSSPTEDPRHNSSSPSELEQVDEGDGGERERSWTAYDVVCPNCCRRAHGVESYDGVLCYFECVECGQYLRF